ncbi:tape measure protein [Parabacteroides sp. OttesenSCG-928-K15]|nr:tape measure protein [Parabacteroides sp. OttesenSCG-928-K15]
MSLEPVDIDIRMRQNVSDESDKASRDFSRFSTTVKGETQSIDNVLTKLGVTVGSVFATGKLIEYGNAVVDVYGKMQMFSRSFDAILGDQRKSAAMMSEIRSLAAQSPLNLTDISKASQTLLGFNVEAEKVMPIIRQLGNISMGESARFNSLALAFAQMSSTGKLMAQDLLQMINAGFNPLSVMAEKTGKSIIQLRKEMAEGSISSEMVADAFRQATEEGGKFYGMMETQSDGVIGLKNQLQGAIQDMLTNIGESNDAIITSSLKGTKLIVQNYETVGKILTGIITTYGAYRAAVISISVAENIRNQATLAQMAGMTKMQAITDILRAKTSALNKVLMMNPYAVLVASVVALGYGLYQLSKITTGYEESLKRLDDLTADYDRSIEKEQVGIDILFERLKKAKEGTESYQKAKDNIINKYSSYLSRLDEEIRTLKDVEGAYKAISAAAIQSAKDRAITKGTEDALSAYTSSWEKNIKKIRKQLIDQFGEVEGTLLLDSLKESLRADGELTKEVEKAIKSFDKTVYAAYGTAGQASSYTVNPLESMIVDIRKSKKTLDNELNEIRDIFGDKTPDEGGEDTIVKTIGEQTDVARQAVEKLKEDLKKLREGITPSSDYAKDIEDKVKALKEAEDRLSFLLFGKSSTAVAQGGKTEQKRVQSEQYILQKQRELQSEEIKLLLEHEQQLLNIEEESFQKRNSQADLNYKKDLQAIREYEDKKAKEQIEYAKRLYVSQTGSEAGFSISNIDTSILPKGLRQADIKEDVKKMYEIAVKTHEGARAVILRDELDFMREEENALKSDLERKLSDIKKYYDDRAREAAGNATLLAKIEENRQKEISEAITRDTLDILDFENDIAERRIKILNRPYLFDSDKRKEELNRLVEYMNKRLNLLRKQQEQFPTDELAREIEEATVALEEYNKELENMPVDRLREGLGVFKAIAGELAGMDGEIGEVFSGIASQIDNISVAFDKEAKTQDKVSAAVSGVVSIINMVTSASQKRKAAEQEFYQNSIALAHEYALALNEQLRLQSELSGSGFINDYSGRLNDGYKALADATNQYNEAISKLSEGKAKVDQRNAIDWGNVGKGVASGAAVGAAVGSVIPVIGNVIGGVVGGIVGGLVGLFGGKKKKNEYGGLLDVFPELVDASGKLNRELAQSLVNTGKLDDKTKQLVENALDWADAVDAANEQIKGITLELAGDLGGGLREAIVGAWKAGEDASKAMFKTAGKSMENFIENLLYSTVFSDVFDLFGEKLADSLNPETGDGDILDDFDWLMEQMGERDDFFLAALEAFKQRAKGSGYDLWNDEDDSGDKRTGTTHKLQSISQDSGDIIVGDLKQFRITTNNLENLSREKLGIMQASLAYLDTIAEYIKYCKHLKRIDDNIEDIKQRGVKML